MRVDPACPERAHAGPSRQLEPLRITRGPPGLRLPDDVEWAVLQLDVWVQLLAMQTLHQCLMLELQQHFDQASHTGRQLEMADIALYRSQPAVCLAHKRVRASLKQIIECAL